MLYTLQYKRVPQNDDTYKNQNSNILCDHSIGYLNFNK
jgi:hypothetical protein